jgi:hypothetical protein
VEGLEEEDKVNICAWLPEKIRQTGEGDGDGDGSELDGGRDGIVRVVDERGGERTLSGDHQASRDEGKEGEPRAGHGKEGGEGEEGVNGEETSGGRKSRGKR